MHASRSEEHTSELQSPCNLVCRLLLEKKKELVASRRRPVVGLTGGQPSALGAPSRGVHPLPHGLSFFFFFFNDTATTEIYTLSLHDALPIWSTPTRNTRASRGRSLRGAT